MVITSIKKCLVTCASRSILYKYLSIMIVSMNKRSWSLYLKNSYEGLGIMMAVFVAVYNRKPRG